jgi:hypothetical protein
MLEDRGQHHHRLADAARQQQGGVADAVLGLALHHGLQRIGAGARFQQRDIEAGVAVVALVLRGVVAGELELVLPFELDGDLFRAPAGTAHSMSASTHAVSRSDRRCQAVWRKRERQ